jgi:hypothetical protein
LKRTRCRWSEYVKDDYAESSFTKKVQKKKWRSQEESSIEGGEEKVVEGLDEGRAKKRSRDTTPSFIICNVKVGALCCGEVGTRAAAAGSRKGIWAVNCLLFALCVVSGGPSRRDWNRRWKNAPGEAREETRPGTQVLRVDVLIWRSEFPKNKKRVEDRGCATKPI